MNLQLDFVNQEMLIFRRYQVNTKKHQMLFGVVEIEFVFPIVGFLVQQILRIINFQIKIKRIFFVIGILTNLRKCSL
jgi:hypothetical protein